MHKLFSNKLALLHFRKLLITGYKFHTALLTLYTLIRAFYCLRAIYYCNWMQELLKQVNVAICSVVEVVSTFDVTLENVDKKLRYFTDCSSEKTVTFEDETN